MLNQAFLSCYIFCGRIYFFCVLNTITLWINDWWPFLSANALSFSSSNRVHSGLYSDWKQIQRRSSDQGFSIVRCQSRWVHGPKRVLLCYELPVCHRINVFSLPVVFYSIEDCMGYQVALLDPYPTSSLAVISTRHVYIWFF